MADFVAIDFETANEKRDSACAIGLALVVDGKIVETKSCLIRPHEMRFAGWNVKIHGITEEDVEDAPTLADIWPGVLEILDGRLVVAHNASFDISVLRHSLHANHVPFPRLDYLCSYRLAQVVWPQLLSHNLAFLAAHHGIELEHHNAESDAKASAELILKAGEVHATSCPLEIATCFEVTLGELYPDGEWIPSSSLTHRGSRNAFEFELPEGLDTTSHLLHQKNVVITGKLGFCTKEEAFNVIILLGGTPKASVSKKTDILITGTQDLRLLAAGQTESSKLRKAKELREAGLSIELITSKDFFEMLFPEV